jgi:putative endonuclease
MSDWYLYMVRCRNGSLYTGISTDVERRLIQHRGKDDTGSKYLKGRGPLTLVFQKKVGSQSLALKVERQIKKLSRARKEKLIGSPEYLEDIVSQANPVAY